MYLVYILQADNLSYIGMTNNFERRWKQHNQILQGGAKYTKKKNNWSPICIVDGFQTKQEAMQCEWRLKRAKGYMKRIQYVSDLCSSSNQHWTKRSPLIKEQCLRIYVLQKYKNLFSFPIYELEWY